MPSDPPIEAPDPLARAEAAYAAGDFAEARAQCAALSAASDPDVATRARALARRLDPDIAAWIAVGASLALFVGILVAYAG